MNASEYDISIPVSTFVKSAFKHRDNVDVFNMILYNFCIS